jgi:replicative DNA helicase
MASKETLTQFGPTFQSKVLASLLGDNQFIGQISDILEPEFFESESNKFLVKNIMSYFIEYKNVPTLEVLKIKTDEIQNDVLKVSVVESLKEAWRYIEATDLQWVKERAVDFCKNQTLKNAIIRSVELLEQKEYDSIKKIVDDALRAGSDRELGHEYLIGLEERLNQSARDTVKTGWDTIDELMDGGLAAGELGVVVAPAGIGKSWTLQSLGANCVRAGLSVAHYTLELNAEYVGLRYDTIFSGVPTGNLKFYQDDVQKKLDAITGYLLIKYYPTRTASVQTLAAHLKQMELQGKLPDMVIVDYADILKPMGNFTERRHQLGTIYEDLRGLAGEFSIPVWTASQANRSSLEEDVIDASKVSEDYSKVMTADFVMSMSRKVEDKIANTGRFHIIKNRFGVDGITFPATINTNTGHIQIFDKQTQQGQNVQGKMNNHEEFLRKSLGQKYQDYKQKDMKGFD